MVKDHQVYQSQTYYYAFKFQSTDKNLESSEDQSIRIISLDQRCEYSPPLPEVIIMFIGDF